MRIISWNLLKGFADKNKYEHIMGYNPDILILSECKSSDYASVKGEWKYSYWYSDTLYDRTSGMGVAVFSNEYELQMTESFNRNFRYVIPLSVFKKGKFLFHLFAVWTQVEPYKYLKAITSAVKYAGYKDYFQDKAVVIGDFNLAVTPYKNKEYLKLMETELIDAMTESEKLKPTYFHNEKNGFYTADYCLVTKAFTESYSYRMTIPEMTAVEEPKARYEGLSDHCPVILDVLE